LIYSSASTSSEFNLALNKLGKNESLGWNGGNFFSYLFLSEKRFNLENDEQPTKETAFIACCLLQMKFLYNGVCFHFALY